MTISTWSAINVAPTRSETAPIESHFCSEISGVTYKASQIPSLSEVVIADLISEISDTIASLRTEKEDAEYRISIGESIDLCWLKRVRFKYNKLAVFRGLLFREEAARNGSESAVSSIRAAKKEAARAIRREKRRLDSRDAHQKAAKENAFYTRKFFYELVKQVVGETKFNEMMETSKEMAEVVAPRPL
jgi:hypothetical protein